MSQKYIFISEGCGMSADFVGNLRDAKTEAKRLAEIRDKEVFVYKLVYGTEEF